MSRVSLSETGIKSIKSFDWVEYFKYNNRHLLKVDYSVSDELTDAELALITPSIKAFQIGEGSDGKRLMKTVKKFAEKTGYHEFREIMRWFVIEENRHSNTLKQYMNTYGIKPVERLWIDDIFRALRKLMGIECEVIILVTAEMIALSYYDALANATDSEQLKTICAQMLHDELRHVVLQSDTLRRISQNRNRFTNSAVRALRKMIMRATAFVVWRKYRDLFIKGGYPYKKFNRYCRAYLDESIRIESGL